MRIRLTWLLLALVACSAGVAPTTSTQVERPSSTTTPTTATTSTTATAPVPEFTVDDCEQPPVTFALLCDVHELLMRHHVNAPLDDSALAAGAALGIQNHENEPATSPSETFTCAVPASEFERLCAQLAERFGGDQRLMEVALEEAVGSMIAFSLDPFTYYIPPELSGALSEDGIINAVGLLLTIRDAAGSVCTVVEGACRVEITLVVADGPAYEAGIEAGHTVVGVDGEPVEGKTLVEVAQSLSGPEGSTVSVEIEAETGETVEHVLERRPPPIPELKADVPRPGVGYVRLPDFGADIPQFMHSVLEAWTTQEVDEIVLDLRDNPGGFIDVATLVASEFLPDGLVLRSESPGETLEYPVQEGGLATSGPPLTVVVNAGSASASEILAGVLQERSRAVIVGEPTFGKAAVQIGFPLRNEGELRVTVARWLTPDGVSVANRGVLPDVTVEFPADATAAEIVDLALGQR